MLLDTHCHLTHPRYRGELSGVLERAWAAGVEGILAVASDLQDAEAVCALVVASRGGPPGARPAPSGPSGGEPAAGCRIWGTAGVHPHEAARASDRLRERLNEALDRDPAIIAVGECGLDFHYDHAPRSVQRSVFDLHLQVAEERDLPVVVHCREAEQEMIGRVEEAGTAGVRGVLHCFPGDLSLMEAAMAADWMVSFTGLVTFRSFEGVEAVRRVLAGRYMLETDGPYMAPVPHRGKRNEPGFVPLIRDRVAELRGQPSGEVETETTEAAVRFFRLTP